MEGRRIQIFDRRGSSSYELSFLSVIPCELVEIVCVCFLENLY